jgi:hypothetical protein
MVFIGTVLCAQNSKLESIYKQIPPTQDKISCQKAEFYEEEMALFESLTNQIDQLKIQLNEEQKISGDETYNTISAGFPSAEELKRVDKLSEAEQQAFWKKFEDEQTRIAKIIESNTLKYRAEKEAINEKVADYDSKLFALLLEFTDAVYNAGNVKSDKRQKIYDTCTENGSLNKSGQQQIEMICVEFCSVVSPKLLKKLRFEYDNLKQIMALHRRFIIIELAEFSTLSEEVVSKQNAAVLDLSDLEFLSLYIDNYKSLYRILPGEIDNQVWSKY